MAETQSEKSSLARLVLLMVCLSIAGSFVAGVHYFTVDLPAQKEVAPQNGNMPLDACGLCRFYCAHHGDEACYNSCASECP
jgi:predicted lipoprotein with Yx(FWY)xxD motif